MIEDCIGLIGSFMFLLGGVYMFAFPREAIALKQKSLFYGLGPKVNPDSLAQRTAWRVMGFIGIFLGALIAYAVMVGPKRAW